MLFTGIQKPEEKRVDGKIQKLCFRYITLKGSIRDQIVYEVNSLTCKHTKRKRKTKMIALAVGNGVKNKTKQQQKRGLFKW
jgi:hypothetical protein